MATAALIASRTDPIRNGEVNPEVAKGVPRLNPTHLVPWDLS